MSDKLLALLDGLPADNLVLLQAAKEAVMAVAGVLLALGVVVSPALLATLPVAVVAVYGLYRAVQAQKARPATPAAPAPTDTPK